ncbi:MAG TPA: DinB family protein [Terracidiphilus sp.]|jgi:uncharacterized damage-inducible protein DinB
MRQAPEVHVPPQSAASKVFAASERINQILIEKLDPALWVADTPGKVRTIAAIFTHMHNTRRKWIRLTAPHLVVPALLKRGNCSREQASTSLAESAVGCMEMLEEAIGSRAGRIQFFRRDGWAAAWPAGLEMLSYMTSHEAHHRGQACMLAHQLGFPLSAETTSLTWNWERLWKELGCSTGPGRSSDNRRGRPVSRLGPG